MGSTVVCLVCAPARAAGSLPGLDHVPEAVVGSLPVVGIDVLVGHARMDLEHAAEPARERSQPGTRGEARVQAALAPVQVPEAEARRPLQSARLKESDQTDIGR